VNNKTQYNSPKKEFYYFNYLFLFHEKKKGARIMYGCIPPEKPYLEVTTNYYESRSFLHVVYKNLQLFMCDES